MAQSVEFFAYDVLLDQNRMREAAGPWDTLRPARLKDHRLAFTGWSEEWRSAVPGPEPAPGESVYGVVYTLFSDQFREVARLLPGHAARSVTVETREGTAAATALFVTAPEEGLKVSEEYLRALDEGMRQHAFSPEIRAALRRWAGREEGQRRA